MIKSAILASLTAGLAFAASPVAAQTLELPLVAEGFDEPAEDTAKGRIEHVQFPSSVFGKPRDMAVYLPAGYGDDPDARYPLLVLRHGGGWDEGDWAERGGAPVILDNLIAQGRAVPMVVAMPVSYMPGDLGSPFGEAATKAAGNELFDDIVPFLRARYALADGPENLALAGLSAGAGQTYFIGIRQPERLSAIGVFSAGVFGGIDFEAIKAAMANRPANMPTPPADFTMPDPPEPFDAERDLGPALANADAINRSLDLFYISIGDEDSRLDATIAGVSALREGGLKIVATRQSGGHVWPTWRQALADFAPRLFRR